MSTAPTPQELMAFAAYRESEKQRVLELAAFIGQFIENKLKQRKTRPFGLPEKGGENDEPYDSSQSLFPPSLVIKAEKMMDYLFSLVDKNGELRQRYSLLESEVTVLGAFRNTLSNILSLTWYTIARQWDTELMSTLGAKGMKENEEPPSLAKGYPQPRLFELDDEIYDRRIHA